MSKYTNLKNNSVVEQCKYHSIVVQTTHVELSKDIPLKCAHVFPGKSLNEKKHQTTIILSVCFSTWWGMRIWG